ncbi:MAG: flagellar export chaperone FlgN [Deltaproteobacteria bacterium]|nr:flagellar export chaperone FlgN [Deltaproteobacteria bacterium]
MTAAALKRVLQAECDTHQRYLALLTEETSFITKFNAEKVEALTAKREELCEKMRELQMQRRELVKELTGSEKTRLSEAIAVHFSGRERHELNALCKRLRELTTSTRKKGLEYSGVVNFALNLVNGTVSLFLAATQNIVKSYNRGGVLKESTSPAGPTRRSGISKEA